MTAASRRYKPKPTRAQARFFVGSAKPKPPAAKAKRPETREQRLERLRDSIWAQDLERRVRERVERMP